MNNNANFSFVHLLNIAYFSVICSSVALYCASSRGDETLKHTCSRDFRLMNHSVIWLESSVFESSNLYSHSSPTLEK